jgi:insertion element IS1 protein InsB
VIPDEQHQATGKGEGQTCHIERFNNVIRQRSGHFVRKTLSFSKSDVMHELCLRVFLHEYSLHCL